MWIILIFQNIFFLIDNSVNYHQQIFIFSGVHNNTSTKITKFKLYMCFKFKSLFLDNDEFFFNQKAFINSSNIFDVSP